MILYRAGQKPTSPRIQRASQNLTINIEELPERPKFLNRTTRERRKFITKVEHMVRTSKEYKDYIKYLKVHFDMSHCEVLPNIVSGNGKKYSIDLHHEPFQLSWITDTVLTKHEDMGETLNPFYLADEITELHYREVVGLIPLSKTQHELVHSDRIMIPLNYVYQRYDVFADEYDLWIPDYVKDLIKLKVLRTMQSNQIQSDVLLNPTVTYIEVDGFNFPEVPPEWENALARQRKIEAGEDDPQPTADEMKGGIE